LTHFFLLLIEPFCFIPDILNIKVLIENLIDETGAIEIRKQLKALMEKPYYSKLNKKEIDELIYQVLLYLAHHYPYNIEDPISLDPLNSQNSMVISTGHRFQLSSLCFYIKNKNFFEIKNPFTNQLMNRRDATRVIKTLEKKVPHFFSVIEKEKSKEIYLWTQSTKNFIQELQDKTDVELSKIAEALYHFKINLFPLVTTGIVHFILMNYVLILNPFKTPAISQDEQLGLLLANFLGLVMNEKILQIILSNRKSLTPKFSPHASPIISSCFQLLSIDYFLSTIIPSNVSKDIFSPAELLQFLLRSYGFYHMALQIKYPAQENEKNLVFKCYIPELLFFIFSNILVDMNLQLICKNHNSSSDSDIFVANHSFYLPISILIYLYSSIIYNIFVESHPTDEDAFSQELAEILINAHI